MTIGQVAGRLGLRTSALRYYERIGLLPPIERVNGRRRYGAAMLTRLEVIDVAKRAGFTMREIRMLLSGFSPSTPPPVRWRALATHKLGEVEDLLERATAMKRLLEEGLRCRCVRLEDCKVFVRHRREPRGARMRSASVEPNGPRTRARAASREGRGNPSSG
jgi:MerR family redox-sensitive transcriptional activator SoxR